MDIINYMDIYGIYVRFWPSLGTRFLILQLAFFITLPCFATNFFLLLRFLILQPAFFVVFEAWD